MGESINALIDPRVVSYSDRTRSPDRCTLPSVQERVIRGEPGDRSAVCVEDVIKREYTRG